MSKRCDLIVSRTIELADEVPNANLLLSFGMEADFLARVTDYIKTLKQENSELLEALRDLADEQNGAPLPLREKEWEKAINKAHELLERLGG